MSSFKYQKKVKLAVHNKHTRWAPFWAVIKAFGKGKRAHPSSLTKHRRHWRQTKLKVKPRTISGHHLG
jgi:ribosomal protein L39E